MIFVVFKGNYMTRCVACDKNLNDFESTRKDLNGDYIDMCNKCYSFIKDDVLSTEREDLIPSEVIEEEPSLNLESWTED